MHGVSLKTLLVSGVMMAALMLTGCGLQVRSVTLIENFEVPSLETLGEDADPGWVEYLRTQEYEITEELCDLNQVQEELTDRLPAFLANRLTVRSVRVVALEFEAQEGNFNSINELDTVLTVDEEYYSFYTGVRPEGLGNNVKLRPKPNLNLADAINNNECVKTYVRISGELPEEALRFNVVLRYRLRLGFNLF
jgi:hypothetical protein